MAAWLLKHNKEIAPVDMVRLGSLLAQQFGGMEGYAVEFKQVYTNCGNDNTKASLLDKALGIFNESQKHQAAPMGVTDMTPEQIAACMRHLQTHAMDEGRDSFGE